MKEGIYEGPLDRGNLCSYTVTMTFAPKHDWNFYEQSVSAFDRNKAHSRTPEERFSIYEDYFDTLAEAKKGIGNLIAMKKDRLHEKIGLHERMVKAYLAMDKISLGKSTSTNT